MLDFNDNIYKKLLDLAIKKNILANCREYPSLTLNQNEVSIDFVSNSLNSKFGSENFSCGLYVHFPFCATRCAFCKYYSEISRDNEVFEKFLDALNNEIKLYKVDFRKKEMDNLFFGGGTPTMLSKQQFERYFKIISDNFRLKRNAQISIEGTPETLSLSKLMLFKKLGINRLSIGLQSASNKVLKKIGRRHKFSDVHMAFKRARKAGFKYIGTEVIWGLPGETISSYKRTIENVIKLSPEYLEGYYLTLGGRVKINRYIPKGVIIDDIIKYYRGRLLSNGYRIYSTNNFFGMIKKGVPKRWAINQNTDSLYNYRSEVMGIGPGSSSHFSDHQYYIAANVGRYMDSLKDNKFPVLYGMSRSKDDYKRLFIIMQIGYFRKIEKKRYYQLFGSYLKDDFTEEMTYLLKNKIVKETPYWYEWQLDEKNMGHESFYMHVIKYWYSKKYIEDIVKKYF